MLTLEEIVERLADRSPSRVAQAIGCRVSTIVDLRKGHTKNPSYETVKALSDYLKK